jgi:hypothetical protein
MHNTLRIAWRQTVVHMTDPLSLLAFALIIVGQEIGWRLIYVSIDSPQSVSLSVIYGFMKLSAILAAISAGARVWQRDRNDRSIVLELLPPAGRLESFVGRFGGLLLMVVLYACVSAAITWQPTMGPIQAMRPAVALIAMEQLIVGCAAAFFALNAGPVIGAFLSLVTWLCALLVPMLIGHLNNQYSPLLGILQKTAEVVGIHRLHVIDAYAIAEARPVLIQWPELIGYSLSVSGLFVFASLIVFSSRKLA